MVAKAKRLLKGFACTLAGVAALVAIRPVAIVANTPVPTRLSDINVGVAEILDTLDRGSSEALTEYASSESDEADEEDPDTKESNLVMANVRSSLNVREEASADSERVGYLYADCGGTIIARDGDWTKIQSGNLIGWASNEYLLFGEEAEELAQSVGRTMATVNTDALRVRKGPSTDTGIWGFVKKGDVIEAIVEDTTDEWVALEFEGEEGFINTQYVDLEFEVDKGETVEEVKAREKREKEEKAKLIANLGPVAVGATDETLLAALVYCEAGNQPYEGQLAVASVVMNRVRSAAYPNTVAGVIYASGQFTPALNGKVEAQLGRGIPDSCLQAAREAIAGTTNIGTATHFRRWTGQEGYVMGAHVFY